MNKLKDSWDNGDPYEYFMGRWSKLMAPEFLNWLNLPSSFTWLEIGCGTGALSEAILKYCEPSHLTCVDPSEDFLAKAKERLNNKGEFLVGNATEIPAADDSIDTVVSGLALNFFPDLEGALTEMKRITKPKGTIAAYVWDYSDRIDLLRYFWDAAILIDQKSRELDEGVRFPICDPDNLENAFQRTGMHEVEVTKLDITTHFKNFDDYWNPFLGGQGPAPSYLSSLPENLQEELRKKIFNKLPFEPDGSIELLGRAIAIKGKV
jgi:ubiquinone/menaquinone biosynthesis C-methylase UbiE